MALIVKSKPLFTFPNLKFPKLTFPKIKISFNKKPKPLSYVEKFELLCPLWYRFMTTHDRGEAWKFRDAHELRYVESSRCVAGEAHKFSGKYAYGVSWAGDKVCHICYGLGSAFVGLTNQYTSRKNLNKSNVVSNFIDHIESNHKDLIGDLWTIVVDSKS